MSGILKIHPYKKTFSNVIHEYEIGNKINGLVYVAQNLITHGIFNNQNIFYFFRLPVVDELA